MPLFKDSKAFAIFKNKCPHCRKGSFFEVNNPYNLKKFDKMHKRCAVCNEDFERETGFYYGAMYVSYGLTVAFGGLLFLLLCCVFNFSVEHFLIVFAITVIVLMPVVYRLSRLLWINMFVKYKK